jgi:hypothetical protein
MGLATVTSDASESRFSELFGLAMREGGDCQGFF